MNGTGNIVYWSTGLAPATILFLGGLRAVLVYA